MSGASFLSSSWPPSCLQPQSRHSGASTVHFLFSDFLFPMVIPNQPPSLILTVSLLAAVFFPNCGGWNQQPRRCVTASCWTACAAGARLQASSNSSPTGSRRLCPSKGSVRRRADLDAYSQGEVEHFHLAFLYPPSGERQQQAEGACPGDGGGQTRTGSGLPGVLVQPQGHAGQGPSPRGQMSEEAAHGSGRLEGALDYAWSNMCISLVSTMSVSAVSALHSPERHHRRPQVSQRGDGTQRVCVSCPPRSSSAAQRELPRPGQPVSLARALCAEGEEDPVTSVFSELSWFIGCSCLSHGCSIEDTKKKKKIMFIFKIPTKSHQVLTPFKAPVCDCLFPAGVPGLRGSRVPALP